MRINWSYGTICIWGLMAAIVASPAMAQITPDATLGNERSRVNRNVSVRGRNADRIEGGATRGANLFHSFAEFNVTDGQRVYFANPTGIANILSRVTGRDVSDIMGTLGVDGGANLFLLNPNGIIFGPNARLDISGSFVASTADRFTFADGGMFSAANPGDGSLLTVTAPLGVQYGPQPGGLSNAGNLLVGQDLTLSAGSITSPGTLSAPSGHLIVEGVAGDVQVSHAQAESATLFASDNLLLQDSLLQTRNDLTLLAGNTVRVRDSVANPFIAYAGGNLTVQGNQGIDIFALNHPSSGLVSGGDMVLRSASTVGGDAHYWSGGSFRIEQLDGDLGSLSSPYDPVIRSLGDVVFDTYTGASLHIFAGGNVTINGDITITGADSGNGISDSFDLVDPSNPNEVVPVNINGASRPTLDIRAGITDSSVLAPPLAPPPTLPNPFPGVGNSIFPNPPDLPEPASGSTITILGSITNLARIDPTTGAPIPGQVFLTNQYRNTSLNPGSIEIRGGIIDPQAPGLGSQSIRAYGSDVLIVSSSDVEIANGTISGAGNLLGGDIQIYSGGIIETGSLQSLTNRGSAVFRNGDINIRAAGNISTGNLTSRVTGTGFPGAIEITSTNGRVQTGIIEASTLNTGGAGRNPDIIIAANGEYIWTGAIRSFVGTYSDPTDVSTGGVGNAGNIILTAPNGFINVNGRIASFTGNGNAGNISLNAGGDVEIFSARSFVGNYDVDRDPPGVPGSGNAGDITITSTTGDITLDPKGPEDLLAFSSNPSLDDFGEITLTAEQGSVILDGATLSSSNIGSGFAGVITIDAGDRVRIRNSLLESRGYAGYVIVQAPSEVRIINSRLDATSPSQEITNPDFVSTIAIGSEGTVILNGSSLTTTNITNSGTTRDTAGDVVVTAGRRVSIRNGFLNSNGEEQFALSSEGYFGQVFIGRVPNFNDSFLRSFEGRFSGVVPRRVLIDSARVTSSTTTAVDDIDVGQVNIRAGDTIRIRNGSQISATTRSQNPRANVGGNINITTNRLQVTNGADLRASTSGEGNAGLIEIRANEFFLDNATIFNNVEEGAMGDAGIIQIATNLLTLTNGAQLQSLVSEADNGLPAGEGNAGEIIIDANDAVYLDGISPTDRLSSLISTSIQRGAIGQGGDIRITTPFLSVTDGAGLTVNARGRRGSAGNIQIRADRIILSDRPEEIGTLSATTRAGNGSGEITIQGLNTGQETFLLLMKNESEISARAFGRANGGNITINEVQDGFILATPENNDIIASAERGRGGEIEINTFAIFGLEERNPLTDLSDINASSEFGTNGEIVRNTLGIDPTRGLGELPIETLDADDQVVEGCIGRNASRDSDVEQGEFSQTGRGGLSPDPTAPLTGETLIEQLATLDEDAGTEANVSPEEPEEIEPLLVEAQGLARNAQNHVTLVASSSTPSSSHLPGVPPNQCDVP